jgi:hypothetical protein
MYGTNKFGAKKTWYNGRLYDSKAEAKYSNLLDVYFAEGYIKSIEYQVKYPLENMDGKKRLRYVADFVVTDNNDNEFILDVKGCLTPANIVKLSYFQFVHKKKVILIPTTGIKAFNFDWLEVSDE